MNEEYVKKFDEWNEYAKIADNYIFSDYFYDREIWWCVLGINIGSEIDGKNSRFERPILILKKINKDKFLIAPLSSKSLQSPYRFPILVGEIHSDVLLSDIRVISSKRLIRKVAVIKRLIYMDILIRLTFLLINPFTKNETPQ